ncbi:xyloglucan O-acetyltransferase 2 [Salvia hispanica]|uniref:xyloglucan O-acetyltransferase 2 n=1 Tax=Salvia hispanica TaxID=49212 RepID=UPI002008FFCC|nr:xyloglucan O-acetyltransferase 2 [Salvia hispanica]
MESSNPIAELHQSLLKKLLCYPLYAIIPILLIHFYLDPFYSSSPKIIIQTPPLATPPQPPPPSFSLCDYTEGEWVPAEAAPLYNGSTCSTIKNGQNCMAYGRPDRDFLFWKWRPRHCDLPSFRPSAFLELVSNKHVAFVGDSLARNQLESLLCMTASAAEPRLVYTFGKDNKFRRWIIPSHNATFSIYWSPFLVKGIEKSAERNYNQLFLDSPNEIWAKDLDDLDILIFSAGHWFLHPAVYYQNGGVLGCHYCENHTEIGFYDVFGRALKTAFESVIERRKEKEMDVILTTFTPAHFEGNWDKLGACAKTAPYREGEKVLEGMNEEMRRVGVERVEEARFRVRDSKVRFRALDVSKIALLRPDGHPGPYMNPNPFANGVGEHVQNDCVHWCLPGPIDTWNQILLDFILRDS